MNEMRIALEITALGMGLVFAAIILLWGLMSLLTAVTASEEKVSSADTNSSAVVKSDGVIEFDLRAQAAAVAVAIALAAEQISTAQPLPDPPTAIVSAWQLGTRTRHLYQKGPIRRPRKIG